MKTKIFSFANLPRFLALLGLLVLVFMGRQGYLQAQQVTQGYASDQTLERGIIVRLKDGDTTKVTPVKAGEAKFMHGVVVAPNDAPLTLSDESEKTFVATQGRFEVLVSNQNGDVKSGDLITISSTEGIGMKADEDSSHVIGKALSNFDSNASVAGQTQFNGKTVQYGRVLGEVTVGANPLFKSHESSLPDFLKRAAESVSGRPVSNIRIYLASFIALAAVLITGSLLYGGVRSSITAIGRNPLSRRSVGQGLIRVILTGLIVFVTGLFAVYLLLKL